MSVCFSALCNPFNLFNLFNLLLRFRRAELSPVQRGSSGISHKGAEPGDSFAEDQILHLVSAFVGEQRFRVGEIARYVVLGGDAVASEYLPRPRDGLATPCRGEG